MIPTDFFATTQLIVVAGKGGVGKTVVSGALAEAASAAGRDVLIVEVEGRKGVAGLYGTSTPGYTEQVLPPSSPSSPPIRVRSLDPNAALSEWLGTQGLGLLAGRLTRSGALDVISTATPGIKDILVLGRVKQLVRDAPPGHLTIVDAPATGHAMTFLTAPATLADTARGGPIHSQSVQVMELLADHALTTLCLVTLPEETPVNETIETAYELEDRIDIRLGPLIVNGVYPELDESATSIDPTTKPQPRQVLESAVSFYRNRRRQQLGQIARLGRALPLEQVRLPQLFRNSMGAADLRELAQELNGWQR